LTCVKLVVANILLAEIMCFDGPRTCRRDAGHTPFAARHTVSTQASSVNTVMTATLVLIDVTWHFLE